MSALIVAIDGPAGVGKSTLAKLLAAELGVPVLDTGAMYRAVAWVALRRGVDPEDAATLASIARDLDLEFRYPEGRSAELWVDGELAGEHIRTPEVSQASSRISTHAEVRHHLVDQQRRIAEKTGAVVEGRDIGTVVFPHTPHKFFLKARPEVRAERRRKELAAAGQDTPLEQVLAEIHQRDARDSNRVVSPLRFDASYQEIDTSDLPPAAIVARMAAAVRGRPA